MASDFQIGVEYAQFSKAVKKLMAVGNKSAELIVKQTTIAFVQSAMKETPPAPGKSSIPAKKYKRKIVEFSRRQKTKTGKTREKATKYYAVYYKTSRKTGRKYFRKKSEANKFAKIKFRGIGRAGWAPILPILGKRLLSRIFSKSPAIGGKHSQVNKTTRQMSGEEKYIQIDNTAKGIENYAKRAQVWGMRKAKNRINAEIKKAEREFKKTWRL